MCYIHGDNDKDRRCDDRHESDDDKDCMSDGGLDGDDDKDCKSDDRHENDDDKIVRLMTGLMVMMVCWQRLVVGEPGPASSRALTKRYERRIVIVIIIVINGHHFHFGHCPQGSLVIANITFNIVSQILKLQERPLEST